MWQMSDIVLEQCAGMIVSDSGDERGEVHNGVPNAQASDGAQQHST